MEHLNGSLHLDVDTPEPTHTVFLSSHQWMAGVNLLPHGGLTVFGSDPDQFEAIGRRFLWAADDLRVSDDALRSGTCGSC